MVKHEMDSASIVEDTERTWFALQAGGRTNFVGGGGGEALTTLCETKTTFVLNIFRFNVLLLNYVIISYPILEKLEY